MKSNTDRKTEFASNNLGQPKVFVDGITWQSGKPTLVAGVFAQTEIEGTLPQRTSKPTKPAQPGSERE